MSEIKISNVSKTIKQSEVLKNINVSFKSGKVYGLQGINGSGKTMLMRIIIGLIRPTKGEVFVNGKQLWKDISFPESIGFLLENPAFIDSYSGYENLKLLASVKKKADNNDIKNTIVRVGLAPDDKKKYKKYSLGMRQRLGIASAILEKPDIILLDEPTNALDADGVKIVKKIINEEKKRGAIVIVACHDADILNEISDEIFVMQNGSITHHIKNEG